MRVVVLAAVVMGCAAFGMAAGARGDEYERKTLRDVGPFKVVVLKPGDSALQPGLTYDAIETAIELRLRRDGIKLADKSSAYLEVSVAVGTLRPDLTLWKLNVEFLQPATLRGSGELAIASTWREDRVSFCRPSEMRGEVMETIDGFVDQFINDYLAANEKVEAGAGR